MSEETRVYGKALGENSRPLQVSADLFVPAPGKILVRDDRPDDVTAGGLTIPDLAQEQKFMGVVVAAIEGTIDESVDLVDMSTYPVGTHVLFSRHAGEELRFDGDDNVYRVLDARQEADDGILGYFKDP